VFVSFADWTGQRTAVAWGTNAGAQPLAFQNWRRFKEAFAPELIARAIDETSSALGRPVRSSIDPFAGSGTTLLASQFLGVDPIGIEVNPYLADLIEAKLTPVDGEAVARCLTEVLASARSLDPHEFYKGGPPTFVEPGVKGRYLFSEQVAARLCGLLNAILSLRDERISRLLRVLLGSAALEVCNAVVSGKGRRYRRNWEERRRSPDDLDRAFANAVDAAVFDATRYAQRRSLNFTLLRGDAREQLKKPAEADLAIFSPPYPNSFDYTDVYNIELWVLGYLRTSKENTNLRHATLRSHVQIKRDMTAAEPVPIIADAIARLREAPLLWNRAIPDMIGAYFSDLEGVLGELQRMLPKRGRVYMVVGDSRYCGIDVPVAAGLKALAPSVGFVVEDVEPFRSMRASPQQGGRLELAESLITLVAI
jgi:DNA modification methylase